MMHSKDTLAYICHLNQRKVANSLWAGTKHFRHLEISHLLSLCGIVYKVIRWLHRDLKRDLLRFLDIYNDIIS